jgi:signal peptidase II
MAKKTSSIVALVAIMALAAAALVAFDQWTKALAVEYLAGKGVMRFAGGSVILVYTQNKGAFLSLGSGLPPYLRTILLVALPAIVLAFLGWALIVQGIKNAGAEGDRGEGRSLSLSAGGKAGKAAAVLLLAGGAGNLVDRIAYGQVRDFLNFGIGSLRTGIMNVADLYILAALVVVGISLAWSRKAKGKSDAGAT